MTTATGTLAAPGRVGRLLRHSAEIARRNLLKYLRTPDALFFSTVQPIIFVLLFRYVLGGSLTVPTTHYVDYLMPGIFVQAAVLGSMITAIGMADDREKGILERFQTMPTARSAVLVGRTASDIIRLLLDLAIMTVIGLIIGFRPGGGLGGHLAGLALVVLAAHTFSWLMVTVGLLASDGKSAQVMCYPCCCRSSIASSAFVRPERMDGWLGWFATHQPVSAVVDATRSFMLTGSAGSSSWIALSWLVGLLVIAAPVAVGLYRRAR